MTIVPITSPDLDAVEVSWFAALCSDDYEFLGVPDGTLRSSFAHCSSIVKEAEAQGFRNILCPSSYQVGQDPVLCRRLRANHRQDQHARRRALRGDAADHAGPHHRHAGSHA